MAFFLVGVTPLPLVIIQRPPFLLPMTMMPTSSSSPSSLPVTSSSVASSSSCSACSAALSKMASCTSSDAVSGSVSSGTSSSILVSSAAVLSSSSWLVTSTGDSVLLGSSVVTFSSSSWLAVASTGSDRLINLLFQCVLVRRVPYQFQSSSLVSLSRCTACTRTLWVCLHLRVVLRYKI